MKKTSKPQAQKPFVPQERYGNTGSGIHQDRRTKRNRTRGAQLRSELRDWGY